MVPGFTTLLGAFATIVVYPSVKKGDMLCQIKPSYSPAEFHSERILFAILKLGILVAIFYLCGLASNVSERVYLLLLIYHSLHHQFWQPTM